LVGSTGQIVKQRGITGNNSAFPAALPVRACHPQNLRFEPGPNLG
jgi:hypothetical protein